MARGYLCLLLHAHLPYVRHPEYEEFLEENWLFEAITECYIPLLGVFQRLVNDGIAFRLTLSLSPPLISMLQDSLLRRRYTAYLSRLIELAGLEIKRTRRSKPYNRLARLYRRWYIKTLHAYEVVYKQDLVGAFGRFQSMGVLDIITSSATHGFLPLLRVEPAAVRAQVRVAADLYRRTFGRPAVGIWLPECGYYPGLEDHLKDAGLGYFMVETHGILNASARPVYGYLAPVACPNGVAAFGRDPDSSRQVWSAETGYPGDFSYREFYRDIGFDLDLDYLAPFLPGGDIRIHTGIKYHRVTGATERKEPYEPLQARRKAQLHAEHFLNSRREQVLRHAGEMDRPPLIVAPYDAELFGHWWFEGPLWLEYVIRGIASDQDGLEMVTPADYLERHPMLQMAVPSSSSWGDKGYNAYWLNEHNDWIYPHLHQAERRMRELALAHRDAPHGSLTDRALCLAGQSLLLAQASDWAFIMKNGTAVEYATRRIRDHISRFNYLTHSVTQGAVNEGDLRALEALDGIFPEFDYRIFAE